MCSQLCSAYSQFLYNMWLAKNLQVPPLSLYPHEPKFEIKFEDPVTISYLQLGKYLKAVLPNIIIITIIIKPSTHMRTTC